MSSILFSIKDGVGIITLNRPDVLNSFNKEMALAMQHALDTCANDNSIRCIFITGAGRAFCAGQDLAEAIAADGPALQSIVKDHYNPIIERIRTIEKPIVCGVNGVAAGAGANIALACDITIAATNASFIQAFSKIGLIPDSSGTFTLPRLIGMQRATAYMMLGDKISAEQAQQIGMIYKVCTAETFADEAMTIATQLATMPTLALGLTKRALNASLTNNLQQQLALEEPLQTPAGKSHDYNEGVNAFLEKKSPLFIGN
nr:2-(1,2-epoxy-1,2-dihydrophenyl)acetyl-CoA isomerase [Bacteroidota bacterium]